LPFIANSLNSFARPMCHLLGTDLFVDDYVPYAA
jgi:hypothetical protein